VSNTAHSNQHQFGRIGKGMKRKNTAASAATAKKRNKEKSLRVEYIQRYQK
jgi:hypothetical protein